MVLLSVPFALVGSVWLLDILGYHLSTAVWIGLVAVVGLAAQTGVVMVVYIDEAYLRRKRAGLIRSVDDIVAAHLEGTVQRLRPKLMTVTTMLAGLAPLLWATSSGADVMRRIAAPMVGGIVSSAFLTLEIIPVVYTYWRAEQLRWEGLVGTTWLPAWRARRGPPGGRRSPRWWSRSCRSTSMCPAPQSSPGWPWRHRDARVRAPLRPPAAGGGVEL